MAPRHARNLVGTAPAVEGVLNLPEGQECCVIGTVYKEMRLKPNILDEYVKVGSHFMVR